MEQIQILLRHLDSGEVALVGQAGSGILGGEAGDVVRSAHRLLKGCGREIRGAGVAAALSSASPADSPATSHHAPLPVATSRPSAQSVPVQNSSKAVSGVAVVAPTAAIRLAFNRMTATTPALRPGSRSSAARASNTLPSRVANGDNSRTPRLPSPRHQVPALIHSATIGG
jgi:hypothetical protein